MWTEAHRARYDARLKEIVSLNAVAEVARWLERVAPPRSGRATPYGAVVRAIAWHLRVGGPWRALPPGGPPWRTVYGWFRKWLEQGLFDRLLGDVARRRRRAMGRRAKPRLSIIDTQSVKCIPVRGPRGYDAAKKVLGRKRVALVDADGTWLAVAVVPASVQDRDTLEALDPGKAAWPSLREAILDGAFTAASCHEWSNRHGMRHRVVERDPAQKGFVVLAGRWVVERSFGWLVHWGGLLRDRAGRLDVSAARIAFAAVLSGVEALLNPMPVQDAARLNPLKQALRDHSDRTAGISNRSSSTSRTFPRSSLILVFSALSSGLPRLMPSSWRSRGERPPHPRCRLHGAERRASRTPSTRTRLSAARGVSPGSTRSSTRTTRWPSSEIPRRLGRESFISRLAVFDLNVPFDQVVAQSIGYSLVRRQCSTGRLPVCGLTHAQHGAGQVR